MTVVVRADVARMPMSTVDRLFPPDKVQPINVRRLSRFAATGKDGREIRLICTHLLAGSGIGSDLSNGAGAKPPTKGNGETSRRL